ncbi:MAG TPA: hypothetical protein H9875_07315 [Candidatus Levilactobacillus faecigallinarum]|uniref:Helix-turn-helix domain-containing protein n=1 Tax=Candidatus Levilactobacillus faecigallinarum TaxID=2838638 RepID=A0A9D1U4Z2_9LACO|nr:hypothetical protein [Candidatus Levilactobacillus faecigallinarum]
MQVNFELSEDVDQQIKITMLESATKAFEQAAKREALPFWMKKNQACIYANVSDKTLKKFIADGLRVTVKGGIERISKKAVDDYYSTGER